MTSPTIPPPLTYAQRSAAPYYRLVYNPTTKVIAKGGLVYSAGQTAVGVGMALFTAATYAAVQTEAASLGLTGLPAQMAGQP